MVEILRDGDIDPSEWLPTLKGFELKQITERSGTPSPCGPIDLFENSICHGLFGGIVQVMPHKHCPIGFRETHYEALPGKSKNNIARQNEFSKGPMRCVALHCIS